MSTNYLNESFLDERCTLNKVLKIVGRRWVGEILFLVEGNNKRFSIIKDQLPGISDHVLSGILADLVRKDLLRKTVYNEVPLHVEYSLTSAGTSLVEQLHILCQWGRRNGYEQM